MSFLRDMLIGLVMAIPVGPVGILCIQRSLRHGWGAGFIAGLGAATADICWAFLAGTGSSALTEALRHHLSLLQAISAGILALMGAYCLWKRPRTVDSCPLTPRGLLATFGTALFITLANPATILAFGVIFLALGLTEMRLTAMPAMLGAIFLGSALWWAVLAVGAGIARQMITAQCLRWMDRAVGVMLLIASVIMVVKLGRL
jgi:threonine/homoserine/homoserine lactone efflux protein